MKCLYKEVSGTIGNDVIMQTLGRLRHIEELKKEIDQCPLLNRFPTSYDGKRTDFDAIQKAMSSYVHIMECMQLLKQLEKLVENDSSKENIFLNRYGFRYKGMSTDWLAIRNALAWWKEFRGKADTFSCGQQFLTNVCSDSETIRKCDEYKKEIFDCFSGCGCRFESEGCYSLRPERH